MALAPPRCWLKTKATRGKPIPLVANISNNQLVYVPLKDVSHMAISDGQTQARQTLRPSPSNGRSALPPLHFCCCLARLQQALSHAPRAHTCAVHTHPAHARPAPRAHSPHAPGLHRADPPRNPFSPLACLVPPACLPVEKARLEHPHRPRQTRILRDHLWPALDLRRLSHAEQ